MRQIDETYPVGEQSQSIGEHVVVKSIDIVFDKGIKPSKRLDVFVGDKEKSAEWIDVDLPQRSWRWRFKDGLCIFPNDKLSIRPLHSRRKPKHFTFLQRDHIDTYDILAKDIISFCTDPGHSASSSSHESDYIGTPPGKRSKIMLKVILRELSSTLVEVDTTSLNPGAQAEVLESISSSKSLQQAVSQLRSVLSVVSANVEVIENLENVVKTFASIHPIAQAAVSALLIPYKLLKAEHEFKKDIQSLTDEMRFLLTLLEDERWIAKLSSTKDAVMEIMKGVIDASLFINNYVNKGQLKQFGAAQTRIRLDAFVKRLEKLRGNFETALNLQNAAVISDIASTVNKSAEDDIEKGAKEFLKEKLEPATQQPLGDTCLQGTRGTILADVEKWLKDSSRPNVLWISGAPGAGKSTISTTIVKRILRFNCARFFVKRVATPELRDPRRIWRTIASGLAEMHRGVKDDITKALREEGAEYPKDTEVDDQFRDLLESPIRKHAESFPADRPCVVVIDALDECRTSDGDWRALLSTLEGWSKLPSKVKLIVTSRNEKDIRDHLQAVSETMVLETGNDVTEETTNDIQLFFEMRFQMMRVPDKSWPGKEVIIRLTRHAAGLFIWAKTVVEFVGHKNWHPPRRLKIICDNMNRGSSDIDGLYGHVLYETFSDMEDQELNVAKFVLAAVSLGKAPFAIQDLVELLAPEGGAQKDETNSAVQMAVEAFSPIINVREPYQLLSVCHKTLSDFLRNETRMQDVLKQASERAQKPADETNLLQYTMRCSEQNARLAEACLQLMNKKLKFNICHIPTSHRFNWAIPNRDALVREYIPRILLYACQYWAEHLDAMDASTSQTIVLPALKDFLWTHILHWLEVLSLTGSMGCVTFSLSCAERYTKVRDDALSELARDAKQFVATFSHVIDCSAPHIYLSALPFAPTESKVAHVYGPRHPNTLSVLTGGLIGRSEMLPLAEMRGHSSRITCLAYLPDGKRIASGSSDGTIRIWDAHSGRGIAGAVLQHDGFVLALSPSPDGDTLSSFCNGGTFRVWDVNEYQCTSDIKVVRDVYSPFGFERAEISPDRKFCAAQSDSQPFKTWRTKDGQLKGITKIKVEKCDRFTSLKFSPDGLSLICGSGTNSIIIQNTKNWEIDVTFTATDSTTCLAVSADGKLFASGHKNGAIQLYEYQERRPLGNPIRKHAYGVSCMHFSADGSLLISGSWDKTLCFWDTKTQKLIGGPHRLSEVTLNIIEALSFSPDGSRLAVAVDNAIQVFDIEASLRVGIVKSPSDVTLSSCVVFDKHQRRFATGSEDGVVRVWDAHSGQMQAEWADDSDSTRITSLAFVQESDVIAFSSESGHVRKGDWKTRQLCHHLLIEDLRGATHHTISPDGKCIAFAVEGQACYISLWDYDTDCEVRKYIIHDINIYNPPTLAFSPDGELIAFESSEGKIEIWRVASAADAGERPTCSFEWETHAASSIVFSPDAKQLALYGSSRTRRKEDELHIWDFATSSEPNLLGKMTRSFDSIYFSLGGDIIVASSYKGTPEFWSVSTGEHIEYRHEIGDILAAELLKNGTLIFVDRCSTIKIWDVGLDGGLPRLLQSVGALDSSNAAEVSFVEDSSVSPQRVVRENRDKSASADNTSISYPAFFDGMGAPAIGDWSYMGAPPSATEGWVQNTGRANVSGEKSYDDDSILFWVPPANRDNFWWPRITAITNPSMDHPVTRIDFSRFMHGENWHLCGEPGVYKKHNT